VCGDCRLGAPLNVAVHGDSGRKGKMGGGGRTCYGAGGVYCVIQTDGLTTMRASRSTAARI